MLTEVRLVIWAESQWYIFVLYLRLISDKQEDVPQSVKAHKAFNRSINTTIYCKGI